MLYDQDFRHKGAHFYVTCQFLSRYAVYRGRLKIGLVAETLIGVICLAFLGEAKKKDH